MNILNLASNIANGVKAAPAPDAPADKRQLAPYAGKEPAKPKPALEPLPPGTMIDGVDCGGMTDDPKKAGIPIPLQAQNRKALTADQQAVLDARKAAAATETAAKKAPEKSAPAKPVTASKGKAKLKPETKAKSKSAAAPKAAKPKGAKAKGAAKAGSKTDIVAKLLRRANGCTGAEILEATGWPSVSVPAMAKAAGLKLKRVKDKGEPTRYWGS